MTQRDRLVIVGVAVLVAVAAFWFFALAPKRKEAADIAGQIDAAGRRLDAAQQSAAEARQAKAKYRSDYAAVAKLGKAVPKSDALPSLLYQLQSAAGGARIDFRSMKVTASSSTPATPAANTSAAVASANGTATSSTPSTGAAASAPTSLPPGATLGAAGLPTMPFSFVFTGSFFDMQHFFGAVQRFVRVHSGHVDVRGRLVSIDGFALTAGPRGFPSVKADVAATTYVLPADAGAAAPGAAPGTGANPDTSASPSASTPAASASASSTETASNTAGGTN
jgi:hypothetical protein